MKKEDNSAIRSKGVIGVWRVKEIGRQKVERLAKDKPFPSLFIFTRHHYSMMWVLGADEPFTERWNPSDEEKIKCFDSMVVNAGTYEIDGNTLTVHPTVARIHDFMGGKLICDFHVENDILRLKFVDEYSFDGVQAPWVAKGGFVLTLMRIG